MMAIYNSKERIEVDTKSINKSFKIIKDMLEKRLLQKGNFSFTSKHEFLGILTEEYYEIIEEIKNDHLQYDESVHMELCNEVIDLAVACIFYYAGCIQKTKEIK